MAGPYHQGAGMNSHRESELVGAAGGGVVEIMYPTIPFSVRGGGDHEPGHLIIGVGVVIGLHRRLVP